MLMKAWVLATVGILRHRKRQLDLRLSEQFRDGWSPLVIDGAEFQQLLVTPDIHPNDIWRFEHRPPPFLSFA